MSDKVGTDPNKPLQVCLDFQSVHVAAFRLRSKTHGGEWKVIATGTYDGQPCHDVAELLPWDSVIDYRFLYTDEEDADIQQRLADLGYL